MNEQQWRTEIIKVFTDVLGNRIARNLHRSKQLRDVGNVTDASCAAISLLSDPANEEIVRRGSLRLLLNLVRAADTAKLSPDAKAHYFFGIGSRFSQVLTTAPDWRFQIATNAIMNTPSCPQEVKDALVILGGLDTSAPRVHKFKSNAEPLAL